MENKVSIPGNITAVLDRISRYCIENELTLAIAESVTSGQLQLLLSNAINAQQFFQGGITAYNGAIKTKILNVEPIHATKNNCVSPKVSREMAQNVCDIFRSEIGIGITGYATKVPEEKITELFAFLCIINKGNILFEGKIEPLQTKEQGLANQQDYAYQSLEILLSCIANDFK